MQSDSDQPSQQPPSPRKSVAAQAPDYSRPIRPIAELLTEPDFPKCSLGEFVDIGGYTGVVVDLVNLSLKVRSPEGVTKSFNANGLRRIYGPVVRPEPSIPLPEPPSRPSVPKREREREPERPAPVSLAPRVPPAVEPDFNKPVKNIKELVGRPDFPQCALGEHVDVIGYTGVVIQIIGRSLKVRSQAETTRSYNADALRKLYAK